MESSDQEICDQLSAFVNPNATFGESNEDFGPPYTVIERSEALLNSMGELGKIGGWDVDLATKEVRWTREIFRIYEIPVGTPLHFDACVNCYEPQ
jgi:hypothetical protein